MVLIKEKKSGKKLPNSVPNPIQISTQKVRFFSKKPKGDDAVIGLVVKKHKISLWLFGDNARHIFLPLAVYCQKL